MIRDEKFCSPVPQPVASLRLLPWATPDGKACYLSTDGDPGSLMSRVADELEEDQLSEGEEALENALQVLADNDTDAAGLRGALKRTAESLGNVLRVAKSRGARLPGPDDGEGEGPKLPAEAFG